ncbi:MAG: Transcriptional regulator, TraR/DksA family [Parcubacteria group bacterium GW2011_GWB1_45_7]|uniref:Zinc finger DksA/TraR C4-type domain-containing protein n=2 Tax=Candidatus Colwelliibacteriota TaxID=1817904 RepID=A0A1G1ZC30_9BACT|nr:MAG: Transcriptional regulator, TraR/DksA family [Parcubacteria group bacterium GW2011_GWB1_45_7]OGY57662.1 MAG: hypothetical protein A3C03_01120 [Candidatus Colwellbacteria bacterium RIFCSPHIGHO2_02_FULL_45_17]OGY60775.1 MAG: hypothetical protein A3I33_02345 [Candidatus Colwellbacteria bacterium RIFCSPLOWO2_02_FULL_45_11]OGY62185.1 MAG: hypothetical protein A3G58_02185 [Candidatus Colwellbacteria bacterium RIFCSPLOWO2_12_FULL_46_17]
MTDQDKEKLKSLLLKERVDLEKRLLELTDVDFGSDIDSGEQESDETEELSSNIPVSNSFRDRLSDIDEALEKMEAGTYGICENCGSEISMDLLQVNPESRLCKNCKANG